MESCFLQIARRLLCTLIVFSAPSAAPALDATKAKAAAESIKAFLTHHMTSPDGAIFVNAVADRPPVAGEARNHDCLSEAVGQMMELAILEDDKAEFLRQFELARGKFAGPSGFLAWKIDPAGERAATSATLDDWRVAYACSIANKKWGLPEAGEFGRNLASLIVRRSAAFPPPAFNLPDGSPGSGAFPLCYLHLPAFRLFAHEVPRLESLLSESQKLILKAPCAPGMIAQAFDPLSGKFLTSASDEVLALITLHYFQSVEPHSEWVKEAIGVRLARLSGAAGLPQYFDAATGQAGSPAAGASVYALFSRILLAAGNRSAAEKCLEKMLEFQNPPGTSFAGAIGGYPVYSFDQLEALLALQTYLAAPSP